MKKVKVMDAKITLVLDISKKDIERAKPGDMDNCVVAQALQRQLGTHQVCVGRNITSVLKEDVLVRFKTPNVLAKNLRIFDKTGCWSLPEGTYELKPPTPSYKITVRGPDGRKRKRVRKNKPTPSGKIHPMLPVRALHSRTSSNFQSALKKVKKIKLS